MSTKTENNIYADFKSFIEDSLNAFDITGWEVKQLYQTIKTEDLTPCVYISILNNKQYGALYRQNKHEDSKYIKKYSNKQEVSIRFQATRRKKLTDTTDTLNGVDVLKFIKKYFQSLDGIKLLSKSGYAQYRGTDIREQSFTNDDENIQLMPYFDCDYLYTDTFKQKINIISDVIENEQKGI